MVYANGRLRHSGRRQRIHLVENADRLQHGAAYNFQALGAELVDGVLRSVPEHIVIAVVEVDEVGGGGAPPQPYAGAFAGLAAELIGEFQQERAGRAAIVGADIGCVAQRVVGVVMTGDDDDAVFGPGKLADDVMDGKLAFGSVGSERVVFDRVALQMGGDVVLDFPVISAANGPRAEGYDLFHVLKGARGIDGWGRTAVGRK